MKSNRLFALLAGLGFVVGIQAQNPIITGQFTADPTARVFEGKLYLYPSHDIPSPIERLKEWFCMADYHVFSSENLVDWTDHGMILSQENVPWVDSESYSMWAPDCVYKDGKYYFYFPASPKGKKGFNVGVAIADKPYGPFKPLPEPIKGVGGIDPCVLLDTDGQAYLYWSGRGLNVAKLKDNMTELASEPVLVADVEDGFKEGPFAFKHNGKYYLTYPWVKDKTECLAYAMSDNPMGPFEYKGIIMEQSPTGCWTNHHSLVEYKGQWYLFYHHNDYSPEFDKNRSVRVDSLTFNPDGTIQLVTPTLRGVGITDAGKAIQLDRYSAISQEGASIDYINQANKFDGWKVLFNRKDAWVSYNRVDFGNQEWQKVDARVLSSAGGTLGVYANEKMIAEIEVPASVSEWKTLSVPVEVAQAGIQDLRVSLVKGNDVQLDWIRFE
ncbi:family 43 glycosylhydrolase [Phocaeicola salanitronis]|uniref:family 43 glycosylhydrolase n=1 Tax=Phocaeicola salanitronis TaxID=376805 RepID=UPI0025A321F1|nr:family 43 glycosylhydrolase [Phocaeicola salanitronis]MDM8305040.1 family 43 glycosylhydrolase [Phocaeicola salanitronis]